MKSLSKIIACLAASLAIAAFAKAEEEKHLELILSGDTDTGLITIKTDELALGESRSFTSEKGRPVILTRGEKGLEIDVDGKKTQIDLPEAGGEGFEYQILEEDDTEGGDAGVERRVIIHKLGEAAAVSVTGADGKDIKVLHETSGDGERKVHKEVRVIRLGEGEEHGEEAKKVHVILGAGQEGHSLAAARAKLIASGALDGLDEATRQKILAALGDGK